MYCSVLSHVKKIIDKLTQKHTKWGESSTQRFLMITLLLATTLMAAQPAVDHQNFDADNWFQTNKSKLGQVTVQDINGLLTGTEVVVGKQGLTDEGFGLLCTLLQRYNPHVETVTVSGNFINSAQPLAVLEKLKNLILRNSQIDPVNARGFLESLGQIANLEVLDLSNTNMKDQGVLYLINAIQRNDHLKTLNLSGNGITDAGVAFLLTRACEELVLESNQITDAGAKLLTMHPTLRKLYISSNPITIEGARALINHYAQLASKPPYAQLKMNGLKISHAEIEALAKESSYAKSLVDGGNLRRPRKKTLYVLSVDGGGIRGIIPALVLQHIGQRLARAINQESVHFADYFDWMAGTSTGGLISLGLSLQGDQPRTKAFTTDTLVEIYNKKGPIIFPKKGWGIWNTSFDATGVESVLAEYFRDKTIGNDTLSNVFITSYDLQTSKSYIFNSKAVKDKVQNDFYAKHVARATSAAPTYFPGLSLKVEKTGITQTFVDGGVYANNPTSLVLQHLRKEYLEHKDIKQRYDNVFVLSLGTGELLPNLKRSELSAAGKLKWGLEIADFLMDTSGQMIEETVKNMVETDPRIQYIRLQAYLNQDEAAMEITTDKHLDKLRARATEVWTRQSNDIDRVVQVLAEKYAESMRNGG